MALPTSGLLSIKTAAGTTRSIAIAVRGSTTGAESLRTLGDLEFGSGARPHGMTEFYGR